MQLKAYQSILGAAVAGESEGAHAASEWIRTPTGSALTSEQRIAIYRNNSIAVRQTALGETYPVVRSLLGETYFHAATKRFAARTPARHADLFLYGADFPTIFRELPGLLEQLPYLTDVARYEWACAEVLRTTPMADHTAVRVFESLYPVDRIHTLCLRESSDGDDSEDSLDLDATMTGEPFYFVLYRAGSNLVSRQIDRDLFRKLSAQH